MVSKNKHNILGISLENKKIKKNKKKIFIGKIIFQNLYMVWNS